MHEIVSSAGRLVVERDGPQHTRIETRVQSAQRRLPSGTQTRDLEDLRVGSIVTNLHQRWLSGERERVVDGQIAAMGGDVTSFVPAPVARRLAAKFTKRKS